MKEELIHMNYVASSAGWKLCSFVACVKHGSFVGITTEW